MGQDLMYYYDKVGGSTKVYFPSNSSRHILGEIQQDFNMSMVIDGTKDSMKVQVLSFSDVPLTPETIVYHNSTQTWWVVSNDKIERYEHEGNAYWLHQLELIGFIELLNARDLTDCGFTDNVYTIGEFLNRLFALSNFEYNAYAVSSYLDLTQKVDFLKTFENYTLLSAIREFLDGYNCSAKLIGNWFHSGHGYAKLEIIPKSGKTDNIFQDSVFNDVRETKTMDKESYGTTIVSNAQNVVSTKAKLFPSIGAVRLSSNEYTIKPGDGDYPGANSNAFIRLPSPVYKVNWVRMFSQKSSIDIKMTNLGNANATISGTINIDPTTKESAWEAFRKVYDFIYGWEESYQEPHTISDNFYSTFMDKNIWYNKILETMSIVFYNDDWKYDPYIATDHATDDPTTPTSLYLSTQGFPKPIFEATYGTEKYWLLGKKTLRESVLLPYEIMYWETGSDLIRGFDYFAKNKHSLLGDNPVIRVSSKMNFSQAIYSESGDYSLEIKSFGDNIDFDFMNSTYQVNYIPMSDIKIKLDNGEFNNDTQYYNQTGKLTDSNALSKLLLSYSKEIESTPVTKYGTFYNFATMPSVGSIVTINNKPYVINNISYNFQENEDDSYVIYGEFTLAIYTSTKSLMVNPNTSIRDYAIPQSHNVKRKQVYRDYWELAHTLYSSDIAYYLTFNKVLNIGNRSSNLLSHTAIMRINLTYNTIIPTYYYYQVEGSTFLLKKSVFEVFDFKDNNIIGYAPFNSRTAITPTTLFNNNLIVNTPISYVDDKGQFKTIDIKLVNNSQLNDAYEYYRNYLTEHSQNVGDNTLYNFSCFIPFVLYDYASLSNNHDISISDSKYDKDATEVPVFEYCSQIGDSVDTIIGENVLDTYDDSVVYLYEYQLVNKGSINENNWSTLPSIEISYNSSATGTTLNNAIYFKNESNKLTAYFLEKTIYFQNGNNQIVYTLSIVPSGITTKDIVIRRIKVKNNNILGTDLFMIIKNTDNNADIGTKELSGVITSGGSTCAYLSLYVNHYKLN